MFSDGILIYIVHAFILAVSSTEQTVLYVKMSVANILLTAGNLKCAPGGRRSRMCPKFFLKQVLKRQDEEVDSIIPVIAD